jgi:hypothetical protein
MEGSIEECKERDAVSAELYYYDSERDIGLYPSASASFWDDSLIDQDFFNVIDNFFADNVGCPPVAMPVAVDVEPIHASAVCYPIGGNHDVHEEDSMKVEADVEHVSSSKYFFDAYPTKCPQIYDKKFELQENTCHAVPAESTFSADDFKMYDLFLDDESSRLIDLEPSTSSFEPSCILSGAPETSVNGFQSDGNYNSSMASTLPSSAATPLQYCFTENFESRIEDKTNSFNANLSTQYYPFSSPHKPKNSAVNSSDLSDRSDIGHLNVFGNMSENFNISSAHRESFQTDSAPFQPPVSTGFKPNLASAQQKSTTSQSIISYYLPKDQKDQYRAKAISRWAKKREHVKVTEGKRISNLANRNVRRVEATSKRERENGRFKKLTTQWISVVDFNTDNRPY